MISREQIEAILKINGVSKGSPDEHIRSILLSARYSKDEVDTALMILHEDLSTHKTRVDGLHKVFRTGESLKADEISKLLGIDVSYNDTVEVKEPQQSTSLLFYAIVWLLSVALAASGIMFYMYLNKIGVFYPGE